MSLLAMNLGLSAVPSRTPEARAATRVVSAMKRDPFDDDLEVDPSVLCRLLCALQMAGQPSSRTVLRDIGGLDYRTACSGVLVLKRLRIISDSYPKGPKRQLWSFSNGIDLLVLPNEQHVQPSVRELLRAARELYQAKQAACGKRAGGDSQVQGKPEQGGHLGGTCSDVRAA
ncbi:hypothetical protein [Uliginosibacterium sp. 31-12]|uniref:hypothetical protein n=1 Tax=Uliginosibacterium sp. 31-12 TaxID=3062781 RepID=UPI0026E21ECF|nr:hypothetical protein [Uliginosibacterium sp. 31-12]MDO6385600.1 hypothetical protein [Uliginosibacterium sp. 31-12]